MNDGQQSNSAGNDEGRANSHNSQGGAEIVHASNGSGTPIKSMDDGEQQPEEGNEQQGTIGPSTSITYSRSAPLPTVTEYEGYERVLPGSANRIMTMAEKSLNIEAEDRKAAREMEAADRKAENVGLIVASIAFSFLPWVGFISAVIFAALGNNTATVVGSVIGAITAGPQIIDAVKKKRK